MALLLLIFFHLITIHFSSKKSQCLVPHRLIPRPIISFYFFFQIFKAMKNCLQNDDDIFENIFVSIIIFVIHLNLKEKVSNI